MFGIDDAIAAGSNLISTVVNKIWPDATESERGKLTLALTELKAHYDTVLAQLKINEVEAANPALFVSGWRPFLGWGLGVSLVASANQWLFAWVAAIFGLPPVPVPNTDLAWSVVSGLLGIGAMRSYDKKQGTDTKAVRQG